MPEESKERLPHLLVRDSASTDRYTRPKGGSGSHLNIPPRNRTQHAEHLIRQIEQAQAQETNIINEQKAFGLDAGNGIYLSHLSISQIRIP